MDVPRSKLDARKKRATNRFGDNANLDPATLKAAEPKKSKTTFGFEVDKTYANVKVVDINPEVERSVHFIETKKADDKVKLRGVYNKKGEIVGQQVDWDQEKVYTMTPSDFKAMVKARAETGGILPNLG